MEIHCRVRVAAVRVEQAIEIALTSFCSGEEEVTFQLPIALKRYFEQR